jgi:DtxR family Mn-dependent transcriptional regulator
MHYSMSEENYIKTIYHLQSDGDTVSTNEVAASLQTKPASVTDMLKKLKAKKLLHYERYKGFRLSAEGKKVALGIVRRHRLWEFFLAEKLAFEWNEVHDLAEELEHVSSRKLIDKLDAYLGHPRFDPHGDPIPDTHGRMANTEQVMLSRWPLNTNAEVCGVAGQQGELLTMLSDKQIQIGTKIQVKKVFDFDKSLEIRLRRGPSITISEQLAKSIFVKHVTKT